MIIKGILELFFSLLQIVFSPIALPQLPQKASSYLDQFYNWIMGGYKFI